MTIDGHCREPSWRSAFRSPPFVDAAGDSSPYTELRAVADDTYLYVEVFVADHDIESAGDRIELSVGPLRLTLRPKGTVLPAGIQSGMETDDTIDNPSDLDEEWVNELAIPWSLLGSREVPVRALRIDATQGRPPHALAWPAASPALLRLKAG